MKTMNPDTLLVHFDQISEAPDTIPRLRRFILDLAVRGKLVEQDPNDEPAEELLEIIEKEKVQFAEGGKLLKSKHKQQNHVEDFPYKIPANWKWYSLSDLSLRIHYGYTASANQNLQNVRFLRITDIQDNAVRWDLVPGCEIADNQIDQYLLSNGDILIARTGGTIGKSFLVNDIPVKAVFASYLIRIQCCQAYFDRYLKLFLESSIYWVQLESGSRGTGQPNVNGQTLGKMVVPLPPLTEQHRIVAKVDEMMALCDELEATQTKREKRRDRLVAATLHGLNNGTNGGDFHDTARFYFNHLPRLTTRPEHIHQLRQTILNLAVRGKLVPQDPNDEPTQSLISLIQSERKQRTNKGNCINMQIPIDSESGKFSIPQSWRWVRLGFALNVVMGQSPPGETYNTEGEGAPLINGPVEFSEGPFGKTIVNQYTTKPTKLCRKGDLLLCVRGSTTGRTNIAGFDACIGRGVAALQPLYPDQFIRLFIWLWRNQIIEMGRGIAFPSISRQQIEGLPVPLPPHAEQHRIVAKVDELMALCDELETGLKSTLTTRLQLLESTLKEALFPQDQPQKTT
jgi:type I restriction enzyme, S subunit